MKTVYDLRKFRDTNEKDLNRALFIYSQNIETVLRTDTREIMYWLDEYNKAFKDRFYLLGFYLNDVIIGFAQLVYFVEEKIIFVDYIVIDKEYRKNNTFYEFVEKIKEFIVDENIRFDYILGEVGYYDDNMHPSKNTRTLIRLLKMTGFGILKINYYQPMLGKNNFESELLSVLMIYTSTEIQRIKKETFLLFLKTIYIKHYKRWYDKFFDENAQAEYSLGLNSLINKINETIKKKKYIEINGYSNLYEFKGISPKPKNFLKIAKIIAILLLFAICALIFGTIHVIAKTKFGIDITAQSYIIIASIVVVFFILSLYYEGRTNSITVIIDKIISKLLK